MPGVALIVSIPDLCLLPYFFILTRVPTHKKYRLLCYPLRSNSGWLPIRCAYFILILYEKPVYLHWSYIFLRFPKTNITYQLLFSNIAFIIPSHFIFVPYFTVWMLDFFNTIPMSNSLDPDQAGHFVGPDMGTNCLQRLSANIVGKDTFWL